jgi:hypothetical protein
MNASPTLKELQPRIFLDHGREALQARPAAIDAVGHSGDRVPEHAGGIGLRHRGSLERLGNRVPKAMEAKAVTLQAERLELLAE